MLCEVTSAGSKTLSDPQTAVTPYASCESAPLFVVQVIVAPDAVIADEVIAENVRGPTRETLAATDEPFNVAVIFAAWAETRTAGLAGELGGGGLGGTASGGRTGQRGVGGVAGATT